jgi:hypothetical protein
MELTTLYPLPVFGEPFNDARLSPLARFTIGRHAHEMYGERPFRHHLEQVVWVLRMSGAPGNVVDAGWAHDVVETLFDVLRDAQQRGITHEDAIARALSGYGANQVQGLARAVLNIAELSETDWLKLVSMLQTARTPEQLIETDWAHDVVGTLRTLLDGIKARSSGDVAAMVWAVSGFGANRTERLACVVPKIAEHPGAGWLKLADRYVNLVNCILDERWGMLSVYLKEHDTISAVFPGIENPLRLAYESAIATGYACLSTRRSQVQRPKRP